MFDKAHNILNNKHLLVIGGSEKKRHHFINELVKKMNLETFRFPSNIKTSIEYLDFVKHKKLFKPWYESKSYNNNQILDFHLDWLLENNSLIIIEEIDLIEKDWKAFLITNFLKIIDGKKKGEERIHLIISQKNENGLIDDLISFIDIKKSEKRSKRQVIKQNLELYSIEENF